MLILSDEVLLNLDNVDYICVDEVVKGGYMLEADFSDRYYRFGETYRSEDEAKQALKELSEQISEVVLKV